MFKRFCSGFKGSRHIFIAVSGLPRCGSPQKAGRSSLAERETLISSSFQKRVVRAPDILLENLPSSRYGQEGGFKTSLKQEINITPPKPR